MDDQDFERRMALYRLRYSVNGIIRESNRKQNQIKRSGARMRVIFCPLISLFFAVLAWYNLSGHGDMDVGIVDAVASLAFLAMLVLGAMIDRPVPEDRDTLR